MKYETAEEMQDIIDNYFKDCTGLDGLKPKHPTVTGLALALDLTRQGLIEYSHKDKAFSDTIKRAKSKVEEYIEQALFGTGVTGCIFNLKNNFGWKDAVDHNVGGQNGANPLVTDQTIKLTPDEAYRKLLG